MESADRDTPPFGVRFAALLALLGLGPVLLLRRQAVQRDYLRAYYQQSTALLFVFISLFVFFFVGIALLSYAMVYQRPIYDAWHPEGLFLSLCRKVFLCWLVCWGFLLFHALRGKMYFLPGLQCLIRRKSFRRTALAVVLFFQGLLALLVPLGWHASSLVRSDEQPGAVYLLYEDVNTFPRWLFALGFYRISLASRARFGEGQVLLLPLSEGHIARALAEGRFVFLGSHGMAQGLLLSSGFVKPEEAAAWPKHAALQYVYLTSCDSGSQEAAWAAAFAPAQVVTYDRLTAVAEHVWWMWMTAPGIIAGLS